MSEDERVSAVPESKGSAVVVLEATTLNVRAMSAAFEQLIDEPREALFGRSLYELMPEGPAPRALGETATLLTRDGPREFHAEQVPVQAPGPGAGAILVRFKPIEQAHRARHGQKLAGIGQLALGIAHDFNNVLSVIGTNVELLLADANEGLTRDLLQELQAAVCHASSLTRGLLSIGRKDRGGRAPVDLDALVVHVVRLLGRLARNGVQLETRLEAVGEVLGDAGLLEQVVLNLVLNACDAMPGGGRITLSTRGTTPARGGGRRHLELTVEDTGPGMPPEVLARLFEPFFTTKPPGEGTGLGLTTARQIVEEHGGWIEVTSTPGEGTQFRVSLPLVG